MDKNQIYIARANGINENMQHRTIKMGGKRKGEMNEPNGMMKIRMNAKGREGERKKNPTKHKMETGCSVTTFII